MENIREPNEQFEFEGVSGKYTVKRSIDYQNEPMDVCIFYTIEGEDELPTGKYIVEMYESGVKIGTADFNLK